MTSKHINKYSIVAVVLIAGTLVGVQAHADVTHLDPHTIPAKVTASAQAAHAAIDAKVQELSQNTTSPEGKQAVDNLAKKAHAFVDASQEVIQNVVLAKAQTVTKDFLTKVNGIIKNAQETGPKVMATVQEKALAMVTNATTPVKK